MNGNSRKVLVLTQGIDGGIARMSSFLSSALQEDGFEVMNFYIGRPGNEEYHLIDLSNGIQSLVYTTGKTRSLAELIGLLKSIYIVYRLIARFNPHIIVFNGQMPLLNYFFLGGASKKVFYDHGPQFSFSFIKNLINKIALRFVDKIISVANFSVERIVDMTGYKGEVDVVANCVVNQSEITTRRGFSLPTSLKVLMAARIDFVQKDPLTLIKAAKVAFDRGVNIEVQFAGSGPGEQHLIDYISSYGCSEYVSYLGHVSSLNKILCRYNISCLSSHYESFGLSLVEGMAAGHLAIGSKVCGINEVIIDGENGLLFEEGSYEELAEIFINVYTKPEDYNYCVDAGINDVEKLYTFEIYKRKISQAFKNISR